jgi:hypothetical protein
VENKHPPALKKARFAHLELGQGVVLGLSLVFPGGLVVTLHARSQLAGEGDLDFALGAGGERSGQLESDAFLDIIERLAGGFL